MPNRNDFTDDWTLYSNGKEWNRRLIPPFYDTVTTNYEMFHGNQWINARGLKDFPKPVFNVIKRVITFFVASMTSSATKVQYEPLEDLQGEQGTEGDRDVTASKMISASFDNFAERINLDQRVRDLLFDAAISGDMCVHMWFDPKSMPFGGKFPDVKGQIELELIDGNNIYFGNPNDRRVQPQPYVQVYGRDTVANLQREAKFHQKLKKQKQKDHMDPNSIGSDSDYEEQAALSGKIEIKDTDKNGKAGYIITYRKKTITIDVDTDELEEDGETKKKNKKEVTRVFVSKSLEDRYIYQDIDTGLELYPIAFNNWEKKKNQYHGQALCTEIVPNQIFINRMFAMAMYNLMMTAFPKAVYDQEKISGWSNAIGAAIPVKRIAGESITNIAGYLNPGVMSPQITSLIDLTLQYTKEMLGANDALLGDINPEQASGVSITVTARQSGVPLENPKSNLFELLEDTARIYADMVGNYYGERPVLVEEDGKKTMIIFDFEKLKDLYLTTKVDVGATTYWSETAAIATLNNLVQNELITDIEFFERVPPEYIKDVQGLIETRDQPTELESILMDEFIANLPPQTGGQMAQLEPKQKEEAIMQILGGATNEVQPV